MRHCTGVVDTATYYENALAIRNPELVVISPWSDRLEVLEYDDTIFRHVNVPQQIARVGNTLGGDLPASLKTGRDPHWFYYLNGVADILHSIQPDVIEVHNRPDFLTFFARQFPPIPIVAYMQNAFHDVGGSLTPETVDLWIDGYLPATISNAGSLTIGRGRKIERQLFTTPSTPITSARRRRHIRRQPQSGNHMVWSVRRRCSMSGGSFLKKVSIPCWMLSDSSRRDHGGISC